MSIFKVKQQIPMLLSIMREYEQGGLRLKRVKDITSAIENFHFIFTAVTSQRSSCGISFMYAYHARQLDQANPIDKTKALDELKVKLRAKLPSKDEFIANFVDLHYSSTYTKEKSLIKYILAKYDYYYSSKNQTGTSINYDLMTIEHIYAENDTSKNVELVDIGKVGNLLLMEERLNGKLGNKPFRTKHPVYINSNIFLDDNIKNATEWNTEKILERTKMIAEKLYDEVFKI